MDKVDNRLKCSDEKKSKIKQTKAMTSFRRQSQVCKVYECKIVEKSLNKSRKSNFRCSLLKENGSTTTFFQ